MTLRKNNYVITFFVQGSFFSVEGSSKVLSIIVILPKNQFSSFPEVRVAFSSVYLVTLLVSFSLAFLVQVVELPSNFICSRDIRNIYPWLFSLHFTSYYLTKVRPLATDDFSGSISSSNLRPRSMSRCVGPFKSGTCI